MAENLKTDSTTPLVIKAELPPGFDVYLESFRAREGTILDDQGNDVTAQAALAELLRSANARNSMMALEYGDPPDDWEES